MDKSEEVLANAGVAMKDLNGETRDVSDIMTELAGKWSNLSKETQQSTAVNLAGRYQLSRFLALMQNFSISVQATETALHSQGSATRENEQYMKSLEARIQKMKTAWETMSIAFGNAVISDSIVTLTALFASMMNGVASLVDTIGALPVVLGVLGSGLVLLRASFKMLLIDIINTVRSLLGIAPASATASAGLKGLMASSTAASVGLRATGTAATFAKTAIRGLLSSTVVGIGFVALGAILEGIIGLFSDATKATEDFTDKAEKLNEQQYDLTNLKELSLEYDKLSKKSELSFEEKTKLAQIESELSSKYGITTEGIDGQTKSISENSEAIRAAIELKEAELKIERDRAELDYAANSIDIEKNIAKYKKELDLREESKKKAQEEYDLRTKILSETSTSDPYYDANTRHQQNAARALEKEEEAYNESLVKLEQYTNKKGLALKAAGQNYVDEQERNNVKINGLTRQMIDIYADTAAKSKVPLTELKNNIISVFDSVQNTEIKNAEDGFKILEKLDGISTLSISSINNLTGALSRINYQPVEEGMENAADATDEFGFATAQAGQKVSEMSEAVNKMIKETEEAKSDIDLLNGAQKELASRNNLSTETIKKMNERYGDFIKVTGLSKDAIAKFIQAKKDEKVAVVNAEIEMTKNTIAEIRKRIAGYEIEIEAFERRRKAAASARISELNAQIKSGALTEQQAEQMYGAFRRNQSGVDSNGNVINNSTILDYNIDKADLGDLLVGLNLLESSRSDLTEAIKEGEKSTKDATKSNDKSNQSYTDSNEILTETQKRIIALTDAIKKLQNERSTMVKGSKEYIASLREEKKLLNEKIAVQEKALKNPSELVSTKVKTTTKTASGDSTSSSSNSSYSSSSGSGTNLDNMLSNALGLQGQFTYKQIGGKFDGTFDQFKKRALSDCSQFVQEMFDEFLDINLPRTAAQQSQQGTAVAKKDLQKGDLVFFETLKGKQASHVGIYTGNGKFIQMGNSGLKEQSLDSSYWAPKYRSARRISGVGESTLTSVPSTNSSATKTKTTSKNGKVTTEITKATQKELEDAKRETTLDISSDKAQAYQLGIEIVEAIIAGTDNEIDKLQSKRELSANKQSRLTMDSADWRKEEMTQSSLLQQEQKLIEKQSADIRKELAAQKITQGEFDAKMADNSAKWWAKQGEIDEKRKNVYDSQLAAYDKQVQADEDALATSEANLKLMTEGTVEYNKELRSQIPILEHKGSVLAKEIEYTKSLLANGKLNAEMTDYFSGRLQDLTLSLLDTNSALSDVNKTLKDLRESAADNIIEEYKKVIEKQQDLALDALDQEREKEDERHEERTKNIDDEQKQFEDYINARLKAFDRENAKVDHDEELAKKTKERNKILSDINDLSLDDSIEADAKRKTLKEQLASVEEEIFKFQRDRERELIKQGLQDQLDNRKDNNDKIKNEEDKKHKDALDNIDKEKKETERKYKDILEDQKYFYDLKKGLMSDDALVVTATLGIIGNEYDKLFANMKTHIFETSKEMQNLAYQFQQGQVSLTKFKLGDYSETDNYSNNTETENSNDSSGTIKGTMASRQAWTEYLSNKQQAESIKKEMSKLDKSSSQYKQFTADFNKLKSKNDQLRSVYGFPDGSYTDLVSQKIFSAETGGMTPAFPGGKFLLAHEKELMLNKSDTSNVLKIVDVARDMFNRFKSGINLNNLLPKLAPSPANSYGDIKVHIDRLNTDEAGAKDFFTRIASERRKKGF